MFQPCWGVVKGPTGNRYGELASLVKYYYHYYYYYYCCCFSAFFFLSLLFFLSFLGYFSVKVPFSIIWGLMADLPGFTSRWGIIQSRREVLKVEVPGHTISLLPIFMEPCTCDIKNLRLDRKHLHIVLFFLFTQMNPKPTQRVLVLRFSVTKEPLVLYQFPGISLRVMVATQPAMCLQCLVTSLSQLERIPSLLPLNLCQTT